MNSDKEENSNGPTLHANFYMFMIGLEHIWISLDQRTGRGSRAVGGKTLSFVLG